MRLARARLVAPVASALLLASASGAWADDPDAAERQYRIARRLAAEGSPEARAALEKVIELDPVGRLADDALVDQALLESLPRWPEAVGWLDAAAATRALRLLDDVARRFPEADRVQEALYHRGLLRLEPLATYDLSAARVDLTAVATSSSPWSPAARLALAWLHELQGTDERAFDAYQRLLVDSPADPAGVRARVGLARVLLRRGSFGLAACRLQAAIGAGVAADAHAEAMRELAVRLLLREAGAVDPSRLDRVRTGMRSLVDFAPTAAGGVLLGDRKQQSVVELNAEGERIGEWAMENLQALVVDPRGRRFAAANTTLYRLEAGRQAIPVASLGDYAPLSRLAADAAGGFWLLDRRGKRIGRIDPGQGGPEAYWESDGSRLLSLVSDGRRLIAIDGKTRTVVALEPGATRLTLTDRDLVRPVTLATDAAGRIAVLDGRTLAVRFLRADGSLAADPVPSPEGARPVAIGLGPEGELHLVDSGGEWIVFR
jgi:hypothetical protein